MLTRSPLPNGVRRVIFGEFTRSELDMPSGIFRNEGCSERPGSEQLTSEEAAKTILESLGAQAITFSAGGGVSESADSINSSIADQLSRNGMTVAEVAALRSGLVYVGTALVPETMIYDGYRIIE